MNDTDAAGERRFLAREDRPLLLDGATGTELERRGSDTRLPLWSARALLESPDLVERIHSDYAEAGADLLTANTFRTQRRALAGAGLGHRAGELTALGVRLARRVADRREPRLRVLGSAPPLEDCYRPDLVPDDVTLAREHAEHAAHLVSAGVDAILVETMNTVREAVAAVRAARVAGAPVLVSFVCWKGATLLSGEALEDAVAAVVRASADAVGVNCLPTSNVSACLAALGGATRPFLVYANLGEPEDVTGFRRSHDLSPEEFAEEAAGWVAAGARLVGGCCGTGPDHIRAIAARIAPSAGAAGR